MYSHWLFLALGQFLCIILFVYQIVIGRHPNGVRGANYQILMLREMMCVDDFLVLAFYAAIIYKFSAWDIKDQEKPLALLSSKLRYKILTG